MKIQVELELDISAKAVYRNGEILLSLTGTMPLASGQERNVSSTMDNDFSEKVVGLFDKAFKALIEENQEKLVTITQVGASEALSVASRMGEL